MPLLQKECTKEGVDREVEAEVESNVDPKIQVVIKRIRSNVSFVASKAT